MSMMHDCIHYQQEEQTLEYLSKRDTNSAYIVSCIKKNKDRVKTHLSSLCRKKLLKDVAIWFLDF